MTPVKYECDANDITGTFARSKILLTEKLTNGALVTPTPDIFTWVNYLSMQKSSLAAMYSKKGSCLSITLLIEPRYLLQYMISI